MSGECQHPRQMTDEGRLLPCAVPWCPKGQESAELRFIWRPESSLSWRRSGEPVSPEKLRSEIRTYGRDAGIDGFFWRRHPEATPHALAGKLAEAIGWNEKLTAENEQLRAERDLLEAAVQKGAAR